MLTRPQQILLKRAQAEAGLADGEYREALAVVSGLADCSSSKDRRLTDEHLDAAMSYFEAIHWRKVDAGVLQASCKVDAVFRVRGYWAGKNRRGNTSRDRYGEEQMRAAVSSLEQELAVLGYGLAYLRVIERNAGSLAGYLGALQRTVASKRRKLAKAVDQPF